MAEKPWWRFYTAAVDDPKLIRLSDALHRTWCNLLCVANRHDGVIPDDMVELQITLRKSPALIKEQMLDLHNAGLLERVGGKVMPHNWHGRQSYDSSGAERQKRYRRRHATVTAKSDGTVTDTVTVAQRDGRNGIQRQRQKEKNAPPNGGAGADAPSAPAKVAGDDPPKTPKPKRERSSRNGSRIPEDFKPDMKAARDLGMTDPQMFSEMAKFFDHFRSVPDNRGGLKVDWMATWRQWCRRVMGDGGPANGKSGGYNGGGGRESANSAFLRTLVGEATGAGGVAGRAPGADGLAPADAATGGDDRAQAIDLEPEAYSRTQ